MKPLWIQTLVWIAAVLAAILLALAGPENVHEIELSLPHGASTPR
jgi:hypothetical protein